MFKINVDKIVHEKQQIRCIQTYVASPVKSKTMLLTSCIRPITRSTIYTTKHSKRNNSSEVSDRNSRERLHNFESIGSQLEQEVYALSSNMDMQQKISEKFPAPPAFEELSGLDLSHLSSEERAAILEVAARAKQIDQVETRRVKTIQQQVVAFSQPKESTSQQNSRVQKPQTRNEKPQSFDRNVAGTEESVFNGKPNSVSRTDQTLDPKENSTLTTKRQHRIPENFGKENTTRPLKRCHFCDISLAENVVTDIVSGNQKLMRCSSCGRDVCKSCVVVSSVLAKKGESLCKLCIKQRELAARSNVWLQKRPPNPLHRSTSVDASKMVNPNKNENNDAKNSLHKSSRQRSLSADATNTSHDSKTKIKMSISEALVRQLSTEQDSDKSFQKGASRISKNSTKKQEVVDEAKNNFPTKHSPRSPAGNQETSNKIQANAQRSTLAESKKKNIENNLLQTTGKVPSVAQVAEFPKAELKQIVFTDDAKQIKPEDGGKNLQLCQLNQVNAQNKAKDPKTLEKVAPVLIAERVTHDSKVHDTKQNFLCKTKSVDKNRPESAMEESVKIEPIVVTTECNTDTNENEGKYKNENMSRDSSNQSIFQKTTKDNNAHDAEKAQNDDTSKILSVHQTENANKSPQVLSKVCEKNYKTQNNGISEMHSTDREEGNFGCSAPSNHPLAKQNVPSAYVARRSSIDESVRSMPNTTSICSSLAESEGPAEWSVDELDDNDTLFFVTSSDCDQNNLPSGFAKPSDLRTAIGVCELRTVNGDSDEINYDYMNYENDTEGDFDQFLQDEQDTLMQYTSGLKRVSLYHDLSSMTLNEKVDQTTNEVSGQLKEDNLHPIETKPECDVEQEHAMPNENSKSTLVKNTISLFENQNLHKRVDETSPPRRSAIQKENVLAITNQQNPELILRSTTNNLSESKGLDQKTTTTDALLHHDFRDEGDKAASKEIYQEDFQKPTADSESVANKSAKKIQNQPLAPLQSVSGSAQLAKPVPAKRKTNSIPCIKITAEEQVPSENESHKLNEESFKKESTFSGLDQVQKGDSKLTTIEGRHNPTNRAVSPVQSSVFVNKFGSKVLQPSTSSKLPISPLVTSGNSKEIISSIESGDTQASSTNKVWAVHKAGYFDSDSGSESDEEDIDDDEKELLKFATSSVPIYPEEMEEYDSAKTAPIASPSSKMFFRRTTSTDSFEDLLKRATETPRNRKSGSARIDKLTSRFSFSKKTADDESSIARSVSLSPPNAANDGKDSDGTLKDHVRRMSEPLICQSDGASQTDPTSRLPISPTRGTCSSLPSPNSKSTCTERKDLVVSVSPAKDKTMAQTQNDMYYSNRGYSNMVRCVSCGVLSNSSTEEFETRVLNRDDGVKLDPPKSLQTNQNKKCHSVSSSTQVTPDEPTSGFPFFPSVDLCQLTALIEALKNVQGLGNSTNSTAEQSNQSYNANNSEITTVRESSVVRMKDVSTETSLTGEPIILLKDRVLECRTYRESSIPSPNTKRNTTHACVGTQDNITTRMQDGRQKPYKQCSLPDDYYLQTGFSEYHPYNTHSGGISDAYGENPHYSPRKVLERPYAAAHHRNACFRDAYPRVHRAANPVRHDLPHYSSFPLDHEYEWREPQRRHVYRRPMEIPRRYRGETEHVPLDSSGHHMARDEYCEESYQECLNEIYMPENAELEIAPEISIRRAQVEGNDFDNSNTPGRETLTILPNNNFNLKRSASVPGVTRQEQIPINTRQAYHQPVQTITPTMNRDAFQESTEAGQYVTGPINQTYIGGQGSRQPLKHQVVVSSYVSPSQFEENQIGRSIDGSSYTLSSMDGTAASEISMEGSVDAHRSPSKRTLPQPPAEDEFRWRYNNNKRFNTLSSSRSRINYNRDFQTEMPSRGPSRLHQTMEDLDQEEKELDMRLRYLELGRQTRPTTHSSNNTLHQATVSTPASRQEYMLSTTSHRQTSKDSDNLPIVTSHKASVVNLNESSEFIAPISQRNYVIVDDVTHIVSTESGDRGVSLNESIRAPKLIPQGGPINPIRSSADGHRSTHFDYRGKSSNVHSGWSPMEMGTNQPITARDARRSQYHPNRKHLNQPTQQPTYHTRFVLQDAEELDRAYAESQKDYLIRTMTPHTKYTDHSYEHTDLNKDTEETYVIRMNGKSNYKKPEKQLGEGQETGSYVSQHAKNPETICFQNAEQTYHEVATLHPSNVENQIYTIDDKPHEEDLRTVVSDTEAYNLRQELNDWFDKPRDYNGRKSGSAYAEFSNDTKNY